MTRDEWTQMASALEQYWKNFGLPTQPNSSSGAPATAVIGSTPTTATRGVGTAGELSQQPATASPAAEVLAAASKLSTSGSATASASAASSVEAIADSIYSQQQLLKESRAGAEAPSKSSQTTASSSSESTVASVLKTVGMVAGVGPVITGLMKLFAGGDDKSTPVTLDPYQAPQSVSAEAGLDGDRNILSVGYSQNGQARSSGSQSTSGAAQIQISVQAMDSRSFMDHSDDIANAVRSAMLRSNSLNDVISEI